MQLDYEVDFHSKLPYGLGFDDKVQQPMAQSLQILKYKNEKAMDELVEKLGYMDYRDALACNRYILEAKQSQDYHQQARAKALAFAFSKLSALQRQKVVDQTKGTKDPKEAQIDHFRTKDPEVDRVYRENFDNFKFQKESSS